ncbi:MAG: hypothetical protein HY364_03580 [Candidatus Aenigmarchaeota archaeon]|nr:hypothetical protein [Candidatus Aenigmarchaeota archaeon]
MLWLLAPASLLVGSVIFFLLGGASAVVIFFMIWFDKIVLRSVTPSILGIELTTISTILMGITLGSVTAFILAIVVMPILEGVKMLLVPTPSEVPPFIPTPYHLLDGLVAAVAPLFVWLPFYGIVALLLAGKLALDAAIDIFVFSKPFDVISGATTFIFNLIISWQFSIFLVSLL